MALAPQPVPQPHSFEPPGGPDPLSGFWLGVAAAVLAAASVVAALCREIAARWRGIVVAHLFFLTLWMAIQVFFFATGAYWCLPNNSSRAVGWLTRSFGTVARCGPAPALPAVFQASTAVAAPAMAAPALAPAAPTPVPPQPPPAAIAAAPQASSSVPPPAAPPPAASAPSPAFGSSPGWSAGSLANCWRNRSIDGGDCYRTVDPRRRSPAPPPPLRYRYSDRPPPLRANPCRRPYDCWPADYY